MQYDFEVTGDNREELVTEADRQAQEFFGSILFVVEIRTVRKNGMPGKTYCADVTASEINTPRGPA